MNNFYYCYSPFVKQFLVEKGIKYITASFNNVTNSVFWLFERSDELDNALTTYHKIKNKKTT